MLNMENRQYAHACILQQIAKEQGAYRIWGTSVLPFAVLPVPFLTRDVCRKDSIEYWETDKHQYRDCMTSYKLLAVSYHTLVLQKTAYRVFFPGCGIEARVLYLLRDYDTNRQPHPILQSHLESQ